MAVSNSTDFSLSAVEIVTEARKKIGIHASEEPLSNAEKVEGLTTLNMMLKAWQSAGISVSHLTEGSIVLTQSDYDLDFGSGGAFTTVPFEITDMRITRNSTDLPMIRLSREEYYALPNKTTEGYPTNWYYDRQRNSGVLYIWPSPDATAGTLKFTYRARIDDMDANTDDLDLAPEWYETTVYNLADRLSEEHGLINTPLGQRIAQKAALSLQEMKEFDNGEGRGSIRISPARYPRPMGMR